MRSMHASLVLLVGAFAATSLNAWAQASAPAVSAVVAGPAVELVKALAWPVVALVMAFTFRRPIAAFVSALGSRITKLSMFKVELELVPASPATVTPLLDDIRTATNPATINDSTHRMLVDVQAGAPADYALVSLGDGGEWLTSRLYVATVMLERMRGVKVVVFVEQTPASPQRFVAVVPVGQLRWAMAQRYPWLEAAWTRALVSLYPQVWPPRPEGLTPTQTWPPALPPGAQWPTDPKTLATPTRVIVSDSGGFEPNTARQLVSGFIESLQRLKPALPAGGGFAADSAEWVEIRADTQERATWVTRRLLESLLPPNVFEAWADALRNSPRARRTRAVLRRVAPFVALVEGEREFVRLVNRQSLLEDIAAPLGEEPEGSAP